MMSRCTLGAALIVVGLSPALAESNWQPFKDADAPRSRRTTTTPQALPPALPAMGGSIPQQSGQPQPDPLRVPEPGFGAPYPGSTNSQGPSWPHPQVQPSVAGQSTRVEVLDVEPRPIADGSEMPQDAWRGVDMAALEQHLSRLTLPPRSATLAQLWWRLLLATADAPAGARTAGHYDAVRLAVLYRAGRLDDLAKRLATGAPDDPVLQAYRIRYALALGNQATACQTSKSLMGRRNGLPISIVSELYLMSGYCAAAEGNAAGTGVAVELAREAKVDAPVALAALDSLAGNGKANMAAPKLLHVLDYRLLELIGPIDPAQILDKAEPTLIAALAADDNAEPQVRVPAAEVAARLNIIDAQQLAAIYAVGAAGEGADVPALRRAALVKSVSSESNAARKLQLARAALEDARKVRLAGPMAEVLALALKDVQPAAGLEPYGETAAEIFLAAGDLTRARAFAATSAAQHWLALIDIADAKASAAQRDRNLVALDELVRRNRFSAPLLHRLATVLDATDVNVPIPLWEAASRTPQPAGGALPDTGVLPQLQDAAKKKDIGRTVLLALQTGGSIEADKLHLIALGDTIRALKRAGLDRDARRFGIEALVSEWPRGNQP